MIDELENAFGFRSLPSTGVCHLSFTLVGEARQRKQRALLVEIVSTEGTVSRGGACGGDE